MTRAAWLLPLLVGGCVTAERPAPAPPPPITLDLDDPVVEADVAGVAMRLRVDFQQKDVIELNPAAAARLPALAWEPGFPVAVGRIVLQGRQARAAVTIGGFAMEAVVAEHGRDCCAGVDGSISPASLPYDPVRLVRADRPAGATLTLPTEMSDTFGLTMAQAIGGGMVRARLTLDAPAPLATAAAGAILARTHGGRFEGAAFRVVPAFGVARQARMLVLARPARIAGFPIDRVAVRFADFSGGRALPTEPRDPADIEVRARPPAPQRDWPAVSLGRAQIDRCREIAFHRAMATITLDCRFDP